MNKLTKVLDIVRKANPSTMELSFGCEIVYKQMRLICIYKRERNRKGVCSNQFMGRSGAIYSSLSDFKIIGHSLYPSHLLVALGKDKSNSYMAVKLRLLLDEGIELTKPLEPQLQANPELVETLFKLLIDKV